MGRFLLILCALAALAACAHEVDPSEPVGEESAAAPAAPAGPRADEPSPADQPPADEERAPDPEAPPPDETPTSEEPPAEDEVPGDENDDGVVNVDEPGPAPAAANDPCTTWTECGPHYDDLNSGFDCVDTSGASVGADGRPSGDAGTCTCDATGQWATACGEIGGSWSSFECFCFTGTETAMPAAAPETPQQAEEDVVCWWTWRWRYCEPDRWVDTSYYDRVCDSDGDCYNDYVEDGYYVDGQCYGRWIKRCTDGNEYWY